MSSLIVEFVTDLGEAHGGWNGLGEKKQLARDRAAKPFCCLLADGYGWDGPCLTFN